MSNELIMTTDWKNQPIYLVIDSSVHDKGSMNYFKPFINKTGRLYHSIEVRNMIRSDYYEISMYLRQSFIFGIQRKKSLFFKRHVFIEKLNYYSGSKITNHFIVVRISEKMKSYMQQVISQYLMGENDIEEMLAFLDDLFKETAENKKKKVREVDDLYKMCMRMKAE